MARVLKLLVLAPIAVIVLAFSIANRQEVSVSFDPFSSPDGSSAFVTAPLFVLLFLGLVLGVVIGGVATWFTQGAGRRRARAALDDAERWREEANRRGSSPLAPLGDVRLVPRSDFGSSRL
jgi:uncharacterized integral membrane protein